MKQAPREDKWGGVSRDGGPERETKGKSWRQRNAVTEETAACEALAGQEAGHR